MATGPSGFGSIQSRGSKQMNLRIESANGAVSYYTPNQLAKEARRLSKEAGIKKKDITTICVSVSDANGAPALRIYYKKPNGLVAFTSLRL